MKKILASILMLTVVMTVTVIGGAEAQEKDSMTLSLITVVGSLNPTSAAITMWKDKVEEATEGRIKVEIRGGPETIPVLEQIEAARNRIVDGNCTFAAYYASLAPEVMSIHLSQLEPWEERKSGFFDFVDEVHNRIGLKYMGRWQIHMPLYVWLKEPIKELADLKGQKLRTMALYDRFFRKLGIVPVSMPHSDIYTALQRGLVVGMGYPFIGARAAGYTEVTKSIIDHSYFDASNSIILLNLEAWNEIPMDLQNKVTQATTEYEHEAAAFYDEMNADERQKLAEEGVRFIKLTPEEAKQYRKMAYDVEWEALKQNLSSETVEKIKSISGN
jgi:TRAP-type C4-dicarboxylate transport system substrate-binding protein